MRRIALTLAVLSVVSAFLTAQAAPAQAPLAFAVASIKPNNNTGSYRFTFRPGGGVSGTLTVERLIAIAYDIRPTDRIVGEPAWARTRSFDIDATPGGTATRRETLAMLQTLLRDHFDLVLRRDLTGKATVWVLTMAHEDKRLGPGIRPTEIACLKASSDPPSDLQLRPGLPVLCGSMVFGDLHTGGSVPISLLASVIQRNLGDAVVDRTGLTGNFDFNVSLPRPDPDFTGQSPDGSIFTIVQARLGMTLQREEVTRDVFVVERVSQPTPN